MKRLLTLALASTLLATAGTGAQASNRGDKGIITLPRGGKLVVVAFLADAKGNGDELDSTIARLARDLYHAAMEP